MSEEVRIIEEILYRAASVPEFSGYPTVDALLATNSLTPDQKLAVGQVLTLPPGAVDTGPTLAATPVTAPAPPVAVPAGPAAEPVGLPAVTTSLPVPAPVTAVSGGDWRAAALSFLGTPYVLGGTSRAGTDCSGLVVQVFTPLGVKLPRVSAAQDAFRACRGHRYEDRE